MSTSYIFTLQEFAQELVCLVDAMGRIYGIEQAGANRNNWSKGALIERYCSIRDFVRRSWMTSPPRKPSLQRRFCMYALFLTFALNIDIVSRSRYAHAPTPSQKTIIS